MAQLKDTVVSGNLNVSNGIQANSVQTSAIKIPTTSGGTTLGPGTAGQTIKSNGTTVYWADDSNTDTNVTQNIKTDNVDRPLLMANYATGSTTTIATTVNRTQGIYANASTGIISANGVSAAGNSLSLSGKYSTFYSEQLDIGYNYQNPYLYADKSTSAVNISNYNYDTTIKGNSLKLQCIRNSNLVDYLYYNEVYDKDSEEFVDTLEIGAQDFDILVNGQKFDVEAPYVRIMDGNGQFFKIENGAVYCQGSTVNITSGTSALSPGTINIGSNYTTTNLRGKDVKSLLYDEDGSSYEMFHSYWDSNNNNKATIKIGEECEVLNVGIENSPTTIRGNTTAIYGNSQINFYQKSSSNAAYTKFDLPKDFTTGSQHTLLAIDGVHTGPGMVLSQAGDSDITIGMNWVVLTGSIAAGSSYTIVNNPSGVTVADLSKYLVYIQPMYGGSASTMHCLYGRLTTPDNTSTQLYVYRESGATTSSLIQFKAFLLKYIN